MGTVGLWWKNFFKIKSKIQRIWHYKAKRFFKPFRAFIQFIFYIFFCSSSTVFFVVSPQLSPLFISFVCTLCRHPFSIISLLLCDNPHNFDLSLDISPVSLTHLSFPRRNIFFANTHLISSNVALNITD